MKRMSIWPLAISAALGGLVGFAVSITATEEGNHVMEETKTPADLGRFSLSLSVADLQQSKAFYESLGFEVIPGDDFGDEAYGKNWIILRNPQVIIGLFQGMFERNTLTFNPLDVRSVQAQLEAKGMTFDLKADPTTTGPAFAMLTDPDGNPVLLDQH
jgi:catechol 2,3-dioxygenase-like lactoylglutathione lyase family enzyme